MKFQKYLRELECRGPSPLIHLNYKRLKGEVRDLTRDVAKGVLTRAAASDRFVCSLRLELDAVAHCWERCVEMLGSEIAELFLGADAFLMGDLAHEALRMPLRPLRLLEPLRLWLEVAAFADALRRHRLLQVAAVVKIEKKFAKAMSDPEGVCYCSEQAQNACCTCSTIADMLRQSPLGDRRLHALCQQLEAAGDCLLRLGLGAGTVEAMDPCPICFGDAVDPSRLPCGHRFCVHCVLPLFALSEPHGKYLTSQATAEHESDDPAAMIRCPLCRAAGPSVPQALSLDSLLYRMQRGLAPPLRSMCSGDEEQRLTETVVSSLAKLAACDVGHVLSGARPLPGPQPSSGSSPKWGKRPKLSANADDSHCAECPQCTRSCCQ